MHTRTGGVKHGFYNKSLQNLISKIKHKKWNMKFVFMTSGCNNYSVWMTMGQGGARGWMLHPHPKWLLSCPGFTSNLLKIFKNGDIQN